MDSIEQPEAPQTTSPLGWSIAHVFSALVLLLVSFYTVAVLAGWLQKERKIDAVHLGILAIAALIITLLSRPALLDRLRLLELKGFKLELLERVHEKQLSQEGELAAFRDIIPLLLSERERAYLMNLERGNARSIKANQDLRNDLRRLRSISLIKMQPGPAGTYHKVHELKDGEQSYDLTQYVVLTARGQRWAKRIRESEESQIVAGG